MLTSFMLLRLAECLYGERRYAECRGAIKAVLTLAKLSGIMPKILRSLLYLPWPPRAARHR